MTDVSLPSIVFVTGTDTDVGKTIATAALAAALTAQGRTVAVYKPTQTGVGPADIGDVGVVGQLAGIESVFEGIRLPDPMAPVAAAARTGATLPHLAEHVDRINDLSRQYDHVLVEGAGGLLVQLDGAGQTLADLAAAIGEQGATIVVCRSGLGTLNHTELTIEALDHRKLRIAGLIIGSWPPEPDDIDVSNRQHLAALGVPLIGAIPAGAGRLPRGTFRQLAPGWVSIS